MQTIVSIVLVNYATRYYEVANCFLLNVPLTFGLYQWGIKASFRFSEGLMTAKQFKM